MNEKRGTVVNMVTTFSLPHICDDFGILPSSFRHSSRLNIRSSGGFNPNLMAKVNSYKNYVVIFNK